MARRHQLDKLPQRTSNIVADLKTVLFSSRPRLSPVYLETCLKELPSTDHQSLVDGIAYVDVETDRLDEEIEREEFQLCMQVEVK